MRRLLTLTMACALGLALGGCATPSSVDFLTLTSPPQAAIRNNAVAISVGPVTLPEYLKRNGLGRRDANGALHYSVTELWAEPLDQGIQRALVDSLSDALDGTAVTIFPEPAALRAHYAVSVSIRQLEATDALAAMAATWQLRPTLSHSLMPTFSGRFNRENALGSPSGPAVARAFSELLHALALEIANAVPAQAP